METGRRPGRPLPRLSSQELSESPPPTVPLGVWKLPLLSAGSLTWATPVPLLNVISHELDGVWLSFASFCLLFVNYTLTFACYRLNNLIYIQD